MILAYPFSISSSGVATFDNGVKSQLRMLLNCKPKSRLHDNNYGYNAFSFEQELLNDDVSPERTLFVVALTEQMARYIPDAILQDVVFERGDNEQEVKANIYYVHKGQKDSLVWQPNSSLI